eukprot:17789-Heterococcus_DN1.PRE.2
MSAELNIAAPTTLRAATQTQVRARLTQSVLHNAVCLAVCCTYSSSDSLVSLQQYEAIELSFVHYLTTIQVDRQHYRLQHIRALISTTGSTARLTITSISPPAAQGP